MRYAQLTTIIAVAAALTAGACNRPATDEAAEPETAQDTAAIERQQRQDEATRMEQRMAELEREWNEAQSCVATGAERTAAEIRTGVEEELAEIREEIGQLRTTTAENWWERTERELEQEAEELEQEVRQFARDWTAPKPSAEVGTTGTDTTWEARRDRLVSAMEARLEAMEEALKNATATGQDEQELEETRARIREMREDTNRLRNASEDDWWDITRQRVNNAIDRIDRTIDRLATDNRG